MTTVKPLNNRHIGGRTSVPHREVVLISEVVQQTTSLNIEVAYKSEIKRHGLDEVGWIQSNGQVFGGAKLPKMDIMITKIVL